MSSSNIKAVAEIELKSDRFTNSAKRVNDSLKNIGTTGKGSLKQVDSAAQNTKQKLTALGTEGKVAGDKISSSSRIAKQSVSQLGQQGQQSMAMLGNAGTRAGTQITTSMNQATASTRNMNVAVQQTNVNMGVMVLGVAALTTSMGTTYTGMTAIDKAHLKLQKSQLKVEKTTVGLARANDLLSATQLAVERFTLSIAKMEKDGKTATDAYTIAKKNLALQNQKLTTANDDYAVKLQDVTISQEAARISGVDLEDTYTNMTLSLLNTGLMSAFLAKTLIPSLSVSFIANKLAIIGNSRVLKFLQFDMAGLRIGLHQTRIALTAMTVNSKAYSINMTGARVSTYGLRVALVGLRAGIKATMVAIGPVGWIILGVTAAYEALAFNIFGARDALVEFTQWIETVIPIFKGLSHIIETLFPSMDDETELIKTEMTEVAIASEILTTSMQETSDAIGLIPVATQNASLALVGLNSEFSTTQNALKTFNDNLAGKGIEKLEGRVTLLKEELAAARLEGIDQLSPAFKQAKDSIMPELEDIAGGLYDAFGESRVDAYLKNMQKLGIIVPAEMDKIKKAVIGINDAIDETKKNYNSLEQQSTSSTILNRNGLSAQVTRKPKVTREFWNSLPPELRGNYSAVDDRKPKDTGGYKGSRNTKREKFARLHSLLGSKAYNVAKLFGLVKTGGGHKLSGAFRNAYAAVRSGQAILNTYEKGRVEFPTLKRYSTSRKGHANRIASKNKVARENFQRKLLASYELAKLQATYDDPDVIKETQKSFALLFSRIDISQDDIFQATKNEQSLQKLFSTASKFGVSNTQFQDFIKTDSGRNDLANIIALKQRDNLLSTLV